MAPYRDPSVKLARDRARRERARLAKVEARAPLCDTAQICAVEVPVDVPMVGARIKPMFEDEAKERQGQRTDLKPNIVANWPQGSKSRDQAALAVNVSPRSVERAPVEVPSPTPCTIEDVDPMIETTPRQMLRLVALALGTARDVQERVIALELRTPNTPRQLARSDACTGACSCSKSDVLLTGGDLRRIRLDLGFGLQAFGHFIGGVHASSLTALESRPNVPIPEPIAKRLMPWSRL